MGSAARRGQHRGGHGGTAVIGGHAREQDVAEVRTAVAEHDLVLILNPGPVGARHGLRG